MSRTRTALLVALLASSSVGLRADAPEPGAPVPVPIPADDHAAKLVVGPDGSDTVGGGATTAPTPTPAATPAARPVVVANAPPAPLAAPAAPKHALVTRSLVLFVHAQGIDYGRPRVEGYLQEHDAWVHHLEENGLTLLAGPVHGDPRVESAIVLPWPDEAAARRFVSSSPGIAHGVLVAEVHPWLAEFDRVVQGAAARDDVRVPHALGFLVRGPAWTPGTSAELRALQDAHLAHLRSLVDDGLVLAGPLQDDGPKRGVVLFRNVKVEDARALEEADPAVRADRLRLLLMEWSLPAGSFASSDS
jgi:uncharacterized protein YciI